MFLASSDPGVTLLLTLVAISVTVGLGFVFAFFIKKNVEHFKEEDEVIADNVVPKTQLVKEINKYIKKYGLDNTVEFIRRYMANNTLKPKHRQSYYDLYMSEQYCC